MLFKLSEDEALLESFASEVRRADDRGGMEVPTVVADGGQRSTPLCVGRKAYTARRIPDGCRVPATYTMCIQTTRERK